jgi:hypothetical protein
MSQDTYVGWVLVWGPFEGGARHGGGRKEVTWRCKAITKHAKRVCCDAEDAGLAENQRKCSSRQLMHQN